MILRDALAQYRTRVSIQKKGFSQERWRLEQISRSFLGDLVVMDVTSVHIATYRDDRLQTVNPRTNKPLAPSTVRLELALLSNFFDIARIEWGLCESNPVANVRKPKAPPGRERRLSPREERRIFRYSHAHSNLDLYSIIVVALETAMRQGEILKLRWENINLKSRIAHLPETKNGSKRDVPLTIKARDAFVRMGVKSNGPVFRLTSNGLKSTWRFMLIKLGIKDLHFHDLRHEAISRLFELGTLDMMEIAAISGHKSLSMLKRYTHLRVQRLIGKLDGHKHRGRRHILDHLIPYPAVVDHRPDLVQIRILDFDHLVVTDPCHDSALRSAQDQLLRRILRHIKDATPIPPPDQYLDEVDELAIVMIDPMAAQGA